MQLLMRIRKLENCAASHAYPSLMDRLDRRMSRRSMFRPAKSTQEKDALGSSSLIPIIDSGEKQKAASIAKNFLVSLSSNSNSEAASVVPRHNVLDLRRLLRRSQIGPHQS